MNLIRESYSLAFCKSQGEFHELHSPNDQSVLTKVQYATVADVEYLLEILPQIQSRMALRPAFERSHILKEVSLMVKAEAESLAFLISSEGGKPLKDARVEVARVQVTLDLCAEETLRLGGETLPMDRTPAGQNHISFTQREPVGAVLAISAFNHPLNLLAHQVGCAVASGCAVVIKPAPSTPISAFKLAEFFYAAGLSEEVIVFNGSIQEIEKLAASKQFCYVSFVGSAQVGWNLRKVIAPGTRLSLEHGGQAPAVIRADADLTLAIPALLKGAYYHAGQVCISTQRIFIHKSIYTSFLENFKQGASKLNVGDATHESTDIGPLIRPSEVIRIRNWISEATKRGAKVVLGNEVKGNYEQYLTATILTEVPRDSKVMTDEMFGPVVCINAYEDEEELLRYLNQNDYVFEASVFTSDVSAALKWAKELSSMTVVINDHSAYRVDWMPFGGHKLSGLGMGGVRYMIEDMTRLKQVIIKY